MKKNSPFGYFKDPDDIHKLIDSFKEKYLYEINRLNMEKENINKSKINSYSKEWMKSFKKVGKLGKIDRNIVDNFIENIYVENNKDLNIEMNIKFFWSILRIKEM